TKTARRPDAHHRREQTDARRTRSHELRLYGGVQPSESLRGSLKYCPAPLWIAATAKQVPRTPCVFVRRMSSRRGRGVTRCGTGDNTWRSASTLTSRAVLSDPPRPCADRRVAAAVRMQDGERVRRARLADEGDEHAAAPDQGLEDAAIVRMEAGAAKR